jgi:hypothetical protein
MVKSRNQGGKSNATIAFKEFSWCIKRCIFLMIIEIIIGEREETQAD